jgi:hypothetical protein
MTLGFTPKEPFDFDAEFERQLIPSRECTYHDVLSDMRSQQENPDGFQFEPPREEIREVTEATTALSRMVSWDEEVQERMKEMQAKIQHQEAVSEMRLPSALGRSLFEAPSTPTRLTPTACSPTSFSPTPFTPISTRSTPRYVTPFPYDPDDSEATIPEEDETIENTSTTLTHSQSTRTFPSTVEGMSRARSVDAVITKQITPKRTRSTVEAPKPQSARSCETSKKRVRKGYVTIEGQAPQPALTDAENDAWIEAERAKAYKYSMDQAFDVDKTEREAHARRRQSQQ